MGIQTLAEWRQHLAPANGQAVPVTPLVPLKIGHMAGLMAAGFLDNQVLTTCPEDECERLLVKGRAYKKVAYSESVEQLPNGGQQLVRTATENVVTDVTTITPKGEVRSRQGAELEGFIIRWLPQLTNRVASNYPPAYAFDYQDGPYARTLNRLSLQRPIPTLGRGGLLPAQKHAAAALVKRLQKHSDALLVGEMGTGKAAPLDSKVLTPTGWKLMGDVQVGDAVVNPEGGIARVIGVFPQGKKDIYRVTFSDGAQTGVLALKGRKRTLSPIRSIICAIILNMLPKTILDRLVF